MANVQEQEPHRGHHHGLEYIGRGYNVLDGHVKDRINHYKLNQIKFAEETSDECVAHEQFNHFQSVGEYERSMTNRIRINQYFPGMFSVVSQTIYPPKSTTASIPLTETKTQSGHSSTHDTFHVASIFSSTPQNQSDSSRNRSQSISHPTPTKPIQLQRTQSSEGHTHHHHQPKVLLPFLCGVEKLDEYHHFIYEITKRAYSVSVIENNIYSPHAVNVADIYASGQSQKEVNEAELKGFLDFDTRFAIVKQAFSPETKLQYYELFDRYGTHIIKQITIGSKAELRWSVKQNSHPENLTKNYELVNKITRTQKHKNMFMNATYYWKQGLLGNAQQAQPKIPKHCIESHTETRTFTLHRSDLSPVGAVVDNANPEKLRPSIDEIGDDVIAFCVEEFSSLFKTPFYQNQIDVAVRAYIEEMSPIRTISALSDGMVVSLFCPDNGGSYITVDQHGHLVAAAVSTQGTPGLTPRFDTPSHTPASASEYQFGRSSSSDLFSSGSYGSYPLPPSATRFFIPSEARFFVKVKGGKFGLQSVKYNSKYISKALWKANFNFHRLQFLGTHESFEIFGDYLQTSGSIHGPTFLYINDDPRQSPSPCGMQIFYDGSEFKKTRLLVINPTIRSVALEDDSEVIEPIYIEDQFHNTDVTNKKKLSTLSPGRVKPEMGVFGTASALIDLSDEAKKTINPPPFRDLPKSNSTSSLFIDDTILMPNIEEMTRCISITLHNWIESGMKAPQKHNIDLFSERMYPLTFSSNNFTTAPSVETIAHFLSTIEKLVKLSPEPAIMFLIYMSRIINKTGLTLDPTNWRRITLSCIILASKVWEDCAVWNSDFLEAFPRITVSDLNRLEKLLLGFLEFNVSIKASEYVKFYFEIRQFFDVHMEKHKLTEALDQKSLEKLQIRTAYSQDEFLKAAKKEQEDHSHNQNQNNSHHHPHQKDQGHHEHHHVHSHDDTEAPDSKHPAHHHGPRGILS